MIGAVVDVLQTVVIVFVLWLVLGAHSRINGLMRLLADVLPDKEEAKDGQDQAET